MKILLTILTTAIFHLFTLAQSDRQFSIAAGKDIFTISQSLEGFDFISMNIHKWNNLASGSFCTTEHLKEQPMQVMLKIADPLDGLCKSGIGFECNMLPAKGVATCPKTVNHSNRFCRAMVRRKDGNVIELLFIDNVDWTDLIKN